MITRQDVATFTPPGELSLKSPPNWTAIIFFGVLSGLHFSISIPAFLHGRWEGYLSFIFAIVFAITSITLYFARFEMTILPREKCLRIRSGVGRFNFHRSVPFSNVHAVRLTINDGGSRKHRESRIEVLCDNEDIDCPPTSIPRQQALFLAILMNVQLIKVSDDSETSEQSDRLL